jgi:Holliday junction resolvase RusA-like endonuclease
MINEKMFLDPIVIEEGSSFLRMTNPASEWTGTHQIRIELNTSAVSSQSKPKQKKAFKKLVRKLTKQVPTIIAGDITVNITWFTLEQFRFEAPNYLDIDNIIKVIMDSFTGPEGLIVDDCVIHSFSCGWIDTDGDEYIEIELEYDPVNIFEKETICFLHLGDNLFHVAQKNDSKEVLDLLMEMYRKRNQRIEATGNYYSGKGVMTVQRLFHKNKIRDFIMLDCEDFGSIQDSDECEQ